MATTASGITIPGSSPTTTPATPIQDHWNDLGYTLNGRVIVPVANTTARSALITDLAAESFTPSASAPVFAYRADATAGNRLEVTEDGTTWKVIPTAPEWAAYTPSWTNLTVGNGSLLARWTQTGTTVHVSLTLTLGSTSSIAGAVFFTLPVTPGSGTTTNSILGSVGLLDTSAGAWRAGGAFRSGSTVRLIAADGTNLGTTSPWTWATGDVITANLTYETA